MREKAEVGGLQTAAHDERGELAAREGRWKRRTCGGRREWGWRSGNGEAKRAKRRRRRTAGEEAEAGCGRRPPLLKKRYNEGGKSEKMGRESRR